MLTRHSRYRRSRHQRRLDDPALLLRRTPQPLPNFNRLAHNDIVGPLTSIVYTANTGRLLWDQTFEQHE
jgi:hypothetical protein